MNNLNIATIEDLELIYKSLKMQIEYVRKDTLRKQIQNQNIILHNKVIIIFRKYKKRVWLNNIYAPKDSYIIYHLINLNDSNKMAYNVLSQFCTNKTVFHRISEYKQMKIRSSIFLKCNFEILTNNKNKTVLYKSNESGITNKIKRRK